MALSTLIKNTKVSVGDTIAVHQEIQEEGKKRIQIFQGIVISIKGMGNGKSFTVRKISSANVGVERIWPVISPSLVKIVVVKAGKVRRSKLYYLRDRIGKSATKVKIQLTSKEVVQPPFPEKPAPQPKPKKPLKKTGAKAKPRQSR